METRPLKGAARKGKSVKRRNVKERVPTRASARSRRASGPSDKAPPRRPVSAEGACIDQAPAPARASVSALDAHIGYWLRAVSNHVSHAFQEKVERLGVTVAEWVVLRACFDRGTLMPRELAFELGLSRGTISKLVDRLEKKGLVKCAANTVDGRSQLVSISRPGRLLVPKLARLADKNDAEAFQFLDERRRAQLLNLLRTVAREHRINGAPLD